jgi:hypothetical protein
MRHLHVPSVLLASMCALALAACSSPGIVDYEARGDWHACIAKAQSSADSYMAKYPDSAATDLYLAGECSEILGDSDGAKAFYSQAQALSSDNIAGRRLAELNNGSPLKTADAIQERAQSIVADRGRSDDSSDSSDDAMDTPTPFYPMMMPFPGRTVIPQRGNRPSSSPPSSLQTVMSQPPSPVPQGLRYYAPLNQCLAVNIPDPNGGPQVGIQNRCRLPIEANWCNDGANCRVPDKQWTIPANGWMAFPVTAGRVWGCRQNDRLNGQRQLCEH